MTSQGVRARRRGTWRSDAGTEVAAAEVIEPVVYQRPRRRPGRTAPARPLGALARGGRVPRGDPPPDRDEKRDGSRLARVAALVQHVDGGVDGEQAAGEGVVQHLRERVAALPLEVVTRDADEVLSVLVAVQ